MSADPRAAGWLDRLEAVRIRLGELSRSPPPDALTEADPRTGERWDWGQVWAHLAEFPAYWAGEIRDALRSNRGDPVPFGRVVSDPARVRAIEEDRRTSPVQLFARMSPDLERVGEMIAGLDDRGWGLRGLHSTLGVMSMERILDEFVVGHLEGHAAQLEELLRAGPSRRPG